jgi:hypothetical protein
VPPLLAIVPDNSIPLADGTKERAVEAPDVTDVVKAIDVAVVGVPPVPVRVVIPPPVPGVTFRARAIPVGVAVNTAVSVPALRVIEAEKGTSVAVVVPVAGVVDSPVIPEPADVLILPPRDIPPDVAVKASVVAPDPVVTDPIEKGKGLAVVVPVAGVVVNPVIPDAPVNVAPPIVKDLKLKSPPFREPTDILYISYIKKLSA